MQNVIERYLGRGMVFASEGGEGGASAGGDKSGAADAGASGAGAAGAGADKGAGDADKGAGAGADKAGEAAKEPGAADKSGDADSAEKKPAAAGDILGIDPAAKKDGDGKEPDKKDKAPPANETPEQKIAREKSEKEARDKAEADKKAGEKKAPKDGYTIDAKAAGLPEGFEVDPKAKAVFDPVAVELDLAPADYNKVVGAYAKLKTAELTAFADTVTGWAATAKADKEIGGEMWDQSVADSRAALDEFGTPALRHYLFFSGNGNHHELVRAFAQIGAALRQGKGVITAKGDGKPKSQGDRLYGARA